MMESAGGTVSWVEPDPVILDRIPRLYAFYQREPLDAPDQPDGPDQSDGPIDADDPADRIRAWVLELPDGRVAMLDLSGGYRSFGVWSSIRSAATRYGEAIDCDPVTLTEHPVPTP